MRSDLAEMLFTPVRSAVSLRKGVLQLWEDDPECFRETAAHVCRTMFERQHSPTLLQNLVSAGLVEFFVGEPAILPREQAEWLAREATALDPTTPVKIARHLIENSSGVPLVVKFRLLDILATVMDGSKSAPLISMLMNRADARLKSRAAIVLKNHVAHSVWIRDQLNHSDPRVRANAIESLWDEASPEHESILRKAAMDVDNRVRGNALLGLYKLHAEGVSGHILTMAQHPNAAFRNTAAWVMGETGDPAFLTALEEMARTDRGAPRMGALRALARMRAGSRVVPSNSVV